MGINNRFGRKCYTNDSVAEFSGDLYLVEYRKCSDKRDAGEGDLIESWDMEYPIANVVIPLIGSDSFNDKLRSKSPGLPSRSSTCTRRTLFSSHTQASVRALGCVLQMIRGRA